MKDIEQLYRDCFGDVYRYLCRLSGDAALAEELTAETFLKAMSALPRFRGDCDEKIWLLRIAKNCFFTYSKKSRREQPLEGGLSTADSKSPEELLLTKSEAERARRLLHALPETYREVFMWRVYAALSFAEIGRLFGKTENWACVSYHRARKMLRERMEDKK